MVSLNAGERKTSMDFPTTSFILRRWVMTSHLAGTGYEKKKEERSLFVHLLPTVHTVQYIQGDLLLGEHPLNLLHLGFLHSSSHAPTGGGIQYFLQSCTAPEKRYLEKDLLAQSRVQKRPPFLLLFYFLPFLACSISFPRNWLLLPLRTIR